MLVALLITVLLVTPCTCALPPQIYEIRQTLETRTQICDENCKIIIDFLRDLGYNKPIQKEKERPQLERTN